MTLNAQVMNPEQTGQRSGPDPVVAPAIPIPDDILALRSEMHALRSELEASRRATVDSLGSTPDRAAVIAALAEWRLTNADTIAEVEAMAAEIREIMADLRPDGLPVRPVPEFIAAQRTELIALRTELAESRAGVIAELGPNATVEDIRSAIAEWHIDNADAIAAMRALSQELANWMRSNRPVREDRAGPSAEVMERRQALQQDAQTLRRERQQLRQDLATATPEEREAIIRAFQQQQRELMQERRELRRLERLGGSGVGGDSRRGG